jgi:hypothetical protein
MREVCPLRAEEETTGALASPREGTFGAAERRCMGAGAADASDDSESDGDPLRSNGPLVEHLVSRAQTLHARLTARLPNRR